jgi:hypothetical protein
VRRGKSLAHARGLVKRVVATNSPRQPPSPVIEIEDLIPNSSSLFADLVVGAPLLQVYQYPSVVIGVLQFLSSIASQRTAAASSGKAIVTQAKTHCGEG